MIKRFSGGAPAWVGCDPCQVVAPLDVEKSTLTWKVYKTDQPCPKCGGRFHVNFTPKPAEAAGQAQAPPTASEHPGHA